MTKDSDPKKAPNYITKAESSLQIAKIALEKNAYDSAVMNAIHSAINALDALTSLYLKKRASGEHNEIFSLTRGIFSAKEYVDVERQFKSLLDLKNASEYQPEMMSPKEAQDSIKWAERIIAKVKAKMKVKQSG